MSVTVLVVVFITVAGELDLPKLRAQLIKHEDKKAKVYKDSEGVPTIGVGFNLQRADARKKIADLGLDYDKVLAGQQTLSEEQIGKLLDADIATALGDCQAVFPKFTELSDVRQRVLVDMMFNLGKPRFVKFEKMIAAVKEGKFDKAADEMKDSKWYRQVKSRGKTLETMMRTDRDP
jgi:GH24 family phage-related lysozyme (muramidase)